MKTSLKNRLRFLFKLIRLYTKSPSYLKVGMLGRNSRESTAFEFSLREMVKYFALPRRSCAGTAKKFVKKSVMHMQSCCFANKTNRPFYRSSAILNLLDLRSIMGCPGGTRSVFMRPFRAKRELQCIFLGKNAII